MRKRWALLKREQLVSTGSVVLVGASGGLNLDDMALVRTGWRFDGVDPSPADAGLGGAAGAKRGRARRPHGVAPRHYAKRTGRAVRWCYCLRTFHFVPREGRMPMAGERSYGD